MTPEALVTELLRQPFPQCSTCTNRAHGLFKRTIQTSDIQPGDTSLDDKTIERIELLCAEHGFKLAGTQLIRSLNSTFKPKSAVPEHVLPSGQTVSQRLNIARAKPSTIPVFLHQQFSTWDFHREG